MTRLGIDVDYCRWEARREFVKFLNPFRLLFLLVSLPAWFAVELIDLATAQAVRERKKPLQPERVVESTRWSAGA